MIFAIDFDGTWSRDPDCFQELASVMRSHCHTSVLVTGRSDEGRWGQEVRDVVDGALPIIFAANGWKRAALDEWLARHGRAGEHVVWIDDLPEYVAPQDPRRIVNRPAFVEETHCDQERIRRRD